MKRYVGEGSPSLASYQNVAERRSQRMTVSTSDPFAREIFGRIIQIKNF
ncbi:MAG: hypothetical protein Q4A75_03165 [Peptostreptococcaceae bacterium]|nr:hypothetical protein [Peptostreptococcaceae bacterium]